MLTSTKAFMAAHFPALLNDKRGVTALEYGMIAALNTFTTISGSL